jgi:hypothetical protein
MTTLAVKFDYFDDVLRAIDRAQNKAGQIMATDESTINKVNKVATSRNYLSQCNVYLRKKANNVLSSKKAKLGRLRHDVDQFAEMAKIRDRYVAERIKTSSDAFYKAMGIKTGFAALLEGIGKAIGSVVDAVKDFYNEHKYLLDFIFDAVGFVLAVVAVVAAIAVTIASGGGGVVALCFAVYALVSSITDLVGSANAFACHLSGDDVGAQRWAERNLLKEGFEWVGGQIDIALGTGDFFKNAASFVYYGAEVASVVYSIGRGIKAVRTAYRTATGGTVKKILSAIKTGVIEKGLGLGAGGMNTKANAIKYVTGSKRLADVLNGTTKAGKFIRSIKRSYELVGEGKVKIIEDISKGFKSLNGAARARIDMDRSVYGLLSQRSTCAPAF